MSTRKRSHDTLIKGLEYLKECKYEAGRAFGMPLQLVELANRYQAELGLMLQNIIKTHIRKNRIALEILRDSPMALNERSLKRLEGYLK